MTDKTDDPNAKKDATATDPPKNLGMEEVGKMTPPDATKLAELVAETVVAARAAAEGSQQAATTSSAVTGNVEQIADSMKGTTTSAADAARAAKGASEAAARAVGHASEAARRSAEAAASVASAAQSTAETLRRGVTVRLGRSEIEDEGASALWLSVLSHTEALSFARYDAFISRVMGGRAEINERVLPPDDPHAVAFRIRPGLDPYTMLRTATEIFLLTKVGVWNTQPLDDESALRSLLRESVPPPADNARVDADHRREVFDETTTHGQVRQQLGAFLGEHRRSYIDAIFPDLDIGTGGSGSPFDRIGTDPRYCCLIELIWSYWHEEGMLPQTLNAIARRFQNVRRPGNEPDPLAEFELAPLRPLGNLLWGYVNAEDDRLSVRRRTYEYQHHYGLTLYGRATEGLNPADSRGRFIEAFHELLRRCIAFYREDDDTTVRSDGFPILNALKEVHLLLAEGAHNQFRDLPWTARVEMLIEQWLMARPEMRDFLRGRWMVPYPERWQGGVDSMKRLQGWTDASAIHFRDLGVFGERLLLTVRNFAWMNATNPNLARSWARYWREEVQGYVHAYRTVAGVDLAEYADATLPSEHLRRRLEEQHAGRPSRASALGAGVGAALGGRAHRGLPAGSQAPSLGAGTPNLAALPSGRTGATQR